MHSVVDDPMVLESRLPYPDALDQTVLVARAKKIQEVPLPENAVHKNVTDANSGYMEVTERGGLEAAPVEPSHFNEHDATSEHRDGAESQPAQEQGPTSPIKSYGKDSLVIEQHHEGSGNSSPLESPAEGTDGGAEVKTGGEKKRKRCSKKSPAGGIDEGAKGEVGGERKRKNWTDDETEILLKAVPQTTEFKSSIDKFSVSQLSLEGIAEAVPGRTGDECRRRMDTLKKSYNAIKEYCDQQKKEFSQLNKEEFEVMMLAMRPKLATRFERSWYNYVRDYCPPRSYKKMTNQGAGRSLEKGVDSVLCASSSGERGPLPAEFHNPDAETTKVVISTPDRVNQSKTPLEAFEAVAHVTQTTLPDLVPHRHPSWGVKHVDPADRPSAQGVEVEHRHASPADLLYLWGALVGVPAHGERHQDPSDLPQDSDLVHLWCENVDPSDFPWTQHAQDLPITLHEDFMFDFENSALEQI